MILCRWCGDARIFAVPPTPVATPPPERPPRVERQPPLPPDEDPVDELEAAATLHNEMYQRRLMAKLLREGGMTREATDAELLEAEEFNAGQAELRMVEVDPEDEDLAPEGSTRY